MSFQPTGKLTALFGENGNLIPGTLCFITNKNPQVYDLACSEIIECYRPYIQLHAVNTLVDVRVKRNVGASALDAITVFVTGFSHKEVDMDLAQLPGFLTRLKQTCIIHSVTFDVDVTCYFERFDYRKLRSDIASLAMITFVSVTSYDHPEKVSNLVELTHFVKMPTIYLTPVKSTQYFQYVFLSVECDMEIIAMQYGDSPTLKYVGLGCTKHRLTHFDAINPRTAIIGGDGSECDFFEVPLNPKSDSDVFLSEEKLDILVKSVNLQAERNLKEFIEKEQQMIAYLSDKPFKFGQVVRIKGNNYMETVTGNAGEYGIVVGHRATEANYEKGERAYYRIWRNANSAFGGVDEDRLEALSEDDVVPSELLTHEIKFWLNRGPITVKTINTFI